MRSARGKQSTGQRGRWDRAPLLGVVLVLLWLLAQGAVARAAPGDGGVVEGGGAEAGGEALSLRESIDRLQQRVASLERELRWRRAAEAASTRLPPGPISTLEAREAGGRLQPGGGDTVALARLESSLRLNDGPALLSELGVQLLGGAEGLATLYDFVQLIDRSSDLATHLNVNYNVAFSLMHLAMLYPDESARLAHALLEATRRQPDSAVRNLLYSYYTVFIRFHRGRYLNLETELIHDLSERLARGEGNLVQVFEAMKNLEYKPKVEMFQALLEASKGMSDLQPILDHLSRRDEARTGALLGAVIDKSLQDSAWRLVPLLFALSKLTDQSAQESFKGALRSPQYQVRDAANLVYFSAPREPGDYELALRYLNITPDARRMRPVILRLFRNNPAVLEELKARAGEITNPDVQALVLNNGTLPTRKPQ